MHHVDLFSEGPTFQISANSEQNEKAEIYIYKCVVKKLAGNWKYCIKFSKMMILL